MGQNCIAGTTEYDEENGIGLVMYVESGSNMILWKMSDGTKEGTTVPVSSDYQNMLKSAFENKTGTRIGYFIFHPYTEETINIESSITINSGDTPTPNTLVKFKDPNSQNRYIAGEITNVDTQAYRKGQLLIYAQAEGQALIVFNNDGKWTGGTGISNLPELFFNACIEAGYELTNSQLILPDWQIGHEIDNWSEYVEV